MAIPRCTKSRSIARPNASVSGRVSCPGQPGQRTEGPIGAEAAIGDDKMEMGVPVGQGAVGLQAGNDADLQIRFPCAGADGGGHGAGGDAGQIAQQRPAMGQ
jgi:hypothetical protein